MSKYGKERPFAASVLKYMQSVRLALRLKDVKVKCGERYDPKSLNKYDYSLTALLLYSQHYDKNVWLYLYILNNPYSPAIGDFSVLKVRADSTLPMLKQGTVVKICVENGTLIHYVGLNKIKKFSGKMIRPPGLKFGPRNAIIRIKILKKHDRSQLPCADDNIAKTLMMLRLVPPLIIELPPKPNDDSKPRLGLIMPIDAGNKVVLNIYDITSKKVDCINCVPLLNNSLTISKNDINCINMVRYLRQKHFQSFLSSLLSNLIINDANLTILGGVNGIDKAVLKMALEVMKQVGGETYEEFYKLWLAKGGLSQLEFLREKVLDVVKSGDVRGSKYLQYLLRPEVLRNYDNEVVKDMFVALHKLCNIQDLAPCTALPA